MKTKKTKLVTSVPVVKIPTSEHDAEWARYIQKCIHNGWKLYVQRSCLDHCSDETGKFHHDETAEFDSDEETAPPTPPFQEVIPTYLIEKYKDHK